MRLQPSFDGLGRAVGKQIDGLTALQVTDQCPVALSAPACPVVQANDSRVCFGALWGAANQTQDGIATSAAAQLTSHIGTSLASTSSPKLTKRFVAPVWCVGHEDDKALAAVRRKSFVHR